MKEQNPPLVTIICLCYNHGRFLKEALDSVLAQDYPNLEVLLVEDESTDNSLQIIQTYLQAHPQFRFIPTGNNRGNCAAFNMAWREAKGAYIIDFATDDVLLPQRVSQQVAAFSALDATYGVVYSDAEYIDDNSTHIGYHCRRNANGVVISPAPSGDVFAEVLGTYFICPPTMMMRREVLEALNGYDETLAYEDFDFWVRSAREYKYFFLDAVTTRRRVHTTSLSRGWYRQGNRLLASTVKVCVQAADLVKTEAEKEALATRVKYEARHAYLTSNYQEAEVLFSLLKRISALNPPYAFMRLLNRRHINLGILRKLYHWLKYKR